MLPAGVEGLSENIRVRSVIGRFLEHSRVFYFCADQDESLYLSSADWMSRNMTRRIELAWPVLDPVLRQRLIDECLIAYLHDARDAWDLASDGQYHRVGLKAPGHSAQNALMQRYGATEHRR
jgi:polyphosphate kinase